MKHNGATPVLTLAVLLTMMVAHADESAPTTTDNSGQEFTYSDDWALVSAPPPPGPYQGVNLDPRIPGQEDNLQQPMAYPAVPAQMADRMMDRFANAPPPAAGQPSFPTQRPAQAARQIRPGYNYNPQYSQRGYGYGRVPGTTPLPYGASPPANSQGWGGGPAGMLEEQVPPPAAYNRMTLPPPGPFDYYGGRY